MHTLELIILSIVILMLLLPLIFLFRRGAEIKIDDDVLLIKYPLKTRKVYLAKEMDKWSLEDAYFLRWGTIYSIRIWLTDGKNLIVSSAFNSKNYDQISSYLHQHFRNKKVSKT